MPAGAGRPSAMSLFTQTAFAAGLFEAASPPPAGLAAWNVAPPQRRYDVYRNNVAASLTGALASRFPAAESIVGPDFFRAMAHAFIRLHPPHSPLLLSYGDGFPDFVASFEPAREIGYLPDVMRIEVARGKAYHAADAQPLDPAGLCRFDPAELGSLTFEPHPSLSILRSSHPAVTIWAMNVGERPPGPIEQWQGEDALIVRPHMIVDVVRLPPGGASFQLALTQGASLGAAAEAGMAASSVFDLSANLAILLSSGTFVAVKQGNSDEDRHDD